MLEWPESLLSEDDWVNIKSRYHLCREYPPQPWWQGPGAPYMRQHVNPTHQEFQSEVGCTVFCSSEEERKSLLNIPEHSQIKRESSGIVRVKEKTGCDLLALELTAPENWLGSVLNDISQFYILRLGNVSRMWQNIYVMILKSKGRFTVRVTTFLSSTNSLDSLVINFFWTATKDCAKSRMCYRPFS